MRTKPAASEVAKKLKVEAFTRPDQVLGKVDAVSVVVPTALHTPVALPFLKAGVHCLLEKPMTIDLAEADLADRRPGPEASRRLLQVGHIERFNPAILAIKEFKGQPLFIEAHRLGPYSPRNTDIDVVLELMIHDLDIVLALVGRKVTSVQSVGLAVLSHTEDIADVRLTFEGGCVANLTASRVTMDKQRKIRLFTRKGYLSVDYLAKQAKLYTLKEGPTPARPARSSAWPRWSPWKPSRSKTRSS